MNACKILGLSLTTKTRHTYETAERNGNRILHDTDGKGILTSHAFTIYTVYLKKADAYCAIHLSEHHCASFSGRLCSIGELVVADSNANEIETMTTHIPKCNLDIVVITSETTQDSENCYEATEHKSEKSSVNAVLEWTKNNSDVNAALQNDPDTCVFKYSRDGNDERNPAGYVYVNMDLFQNVRKLQA
jgi:hypothetical protein